MHAHFLHRANMQLISEKVEFLNSCSLSLKSTYLLGIILYSNKNHTLYLYTRYSHPYLDQFKELLLQSDAKIGSGSANF